MTDILPFLKSIISISGISGYETPVAALIEEKRRPLVDEVSTSRVGSLRGLKKGSGKGKRPAIMIATHMDAIGKMVSKVAKGFLHITKVGGIDVRSLPGVQVTVHAHSGEELPGVIAMPSAKLLPDSVSAGDVLEIGYFLVDTGLTPEGFIGSLTSASYMPVEANPLYKNLEHAAGKVFDKYSVNGWLTVDGETELYIDQPTKRR